MSDNMNFEDIRKPRAGEEWDAEEFGKMKTRNAEIQARNEEEDKKLGFGILKLQVVSREMEGGGKMYGLLLSDECGSWKGDWSIVCDRFLGGDDRLAYFGHWCKSHFVKHVTALKSRERCPLHVFTYDEIGYGGLRGGLDWLRTVDVGGKKKEEILGFRILKIHELTPEQMESDGSGRALRIPHECDEWNDVYVHVRDAFHSNDSRLAFFSHQCHFYFAMELTHMSTRTPNTLHVFTFTDAEYEVVRNAAKELCVDAQSDRRG